MSRSNCKRHVRYLDEDLQGIKGIENKMNSGQIDHLEIKVFCLKRSSVYVRIEREKDAIMKESLITTVLN